jgi:hypothetical protein
LQKRGRPLFVTTMLGIGEHWRPWRSTLGPKQAPPDSLVAHSLVDL